MKNDKKIIIAGVGAILAHLFIQQNKEKKINMSDVSIFPVEFYEQ